MERNGDLINRQAAVDAVKSYLKAEVDAIPKDADFFIVTATCDMILKLNEELCRVLDQLPSAQPERTCVNCGRTLNNGGWYADGGTRCPIEEHYALPKDGFCHLWEERNITDDDYPERREE